MDNANPTPPNVQYDQARGFQGEHRSYYRECRRLGIPPLDVVIAATTGTGKSIVPQIVYDIGRGDSFDKIAVVTANDNLREQMAMGSNLRLEGLSSDFQIMEATNVVDPSRGTPGFCTTFQAVALDAAGIVAFELECRRYALIIDEVHHLKEGGHWHKAMIPLVERAAHVVYMTGTLERSDRERIAFLPYIEQEGVTYVDRESSRVKFISYGHDGARSFAPTMFWPALVSAESRQKGPAN